MTTLNGQNNKKSVIVSSGRKTISLVSGDILKRLRHIRLGHCPALPDCEVCIASKLRHERSKTVEQEVTTLNDKLQIDLLGPMNPSDNNNVYCAVTVDIATRTINVTPIQNKSFAYKAVEEWIDRFGKPTTIQTDGGKELTEGESRILRQFHGIRFQCAPPYEHRYQSHVERSVQKVCELTRSLLVHAGLGNAYWDHAAVYAGQIIDVSTHSALGMSPYQKRTGLVPDVSKFRTFGSKVYYSIPKELRKKKDRFQLDAKTRKGIFVGLATHGYNVVDLGTKSIVNVTNIRFFERAELTVPDENEKSGCNVLEEAYQKYITEYDSSSKTDKKDIVIDSANAEVIDDGASQMSLESKLIKPLGSSIRTFLGAASTQNITTSSNRVLFDKLKNCISIVNGEINRMCISRSNVFPLYWKKNFICRSFAIGRDDSCRLLNANEKLLTNELAILVAYRLQEASSLVNEKGKFEKALSAINVIRARSEDKHLCEAFISKAIGELPDDEWSEDEKMWLAENEYFSKVDSAFVSNKEAKYDPKFDNAIKVELQKHLDFDCFRPATPDDFKRALAKPIPSRLVLTTKSVGQAGNETTKYKARLVCLGFKAWKAEQDYSKFASTVDGAALRSILSLYISQPSWGYRAGDATNAFLNAPYKTETPILVKFPEHIAKLLNYDVAVVQKGLNGLTLSPRFWEAERTKRLKKCGFTPLTTESSIYTKGDLVLVCFVDGLLLFGPSNMLDAGWASIKKEIQIVDDDSEKKLRNGFVFRYLKQEIVVSLDPRKIQIFQKAYSEKLNTDFGQGKAVPCPLTVEYKDTLFPYGTNNDLVETAEALHMKRKLQGSLQHLAGHTRPDISYSLGALSRAIATDVCLQGLKRVIRYCRKIRGLEYHPMPLDKDGKAIFDLQVYADADFAGNPHDRKSISGWIITFRCAEEGKTNLVGWKSVKQGSIATTTTDSEVFAGSEGAKRAMSTLYFLKELEERNSCVRIQLKNPLFIMDNKAAVDAARAESTTKNLKHIDVRQNFLRDLEFRKVFEVRHCATNVNKADGFTKILLPEKFNQWCDLIGLVEFQNFE